MVQEEKGGGPAGGGLRQLFGEKDWPPRGVVSVSAASARLGSVPLRAHPRGAFNYLRSLPV